MQFPKLEFSEDSTTNLCFACGQENPIGLKLVPVYDGEKVRAEFTPGEFHQGWRNVTHGGILYTLLDEITAYAMLCQGIGAGVTAKSEVKFKQVAPLNEPIQISAWVTKRTSRLVETKGVLSLKNDVLIAEAYSTFYILTKSGKTILWDMDGVIVNSSSHHFAAWQDAFSGRGKEFTRKDFDGLFGTRNDFIIHRVLGDEINAGDIETIIQEKENNFRERIRGNIKPLPGAIKLLAAINKGTFRQCLVSSAPRENIDLILSELGIGDFFNCVISGRDVAESKPSPQIFLLAADKCGAVPKNCIVIEDSIPGIRAAKTAGMKCLAITSTHGKQDLTEADRIVDSFEEIDLITLTQRI